MTIKNLLLFLIVIFSLPSMGADVANAQVLNDTPEDLKYFLAFGALFWTSLIIYCAYRDFRGK